MSLGEETTGILDNEDLREVFVEEAREEDGGRGEEQDEQYPSSVLVAMGGKRKRKECQWQKVN